MGKILRINLSDNTYTEELLEEQIAKDFIGGAGFGIRFLFSETSPKIDPLSEENKLIFAVGPFTGSSVPCSSRMAVTAKSPLTGAIGMALSGGYFPAELKYAGYDVLIIEGRAPEPVYLFIKDGDVKIKSAKKIWGTKTFDCQQIIKNEVRDQNTRVACIGPAGENLSKIACIINERRAVGRKGLGAVMGSKNLKAIAIRGSQEVTVADSGNFKQALSVMRKAMKKSPKLYQRFSKNGTPGAVDVTSELGIFPTKNWSSTGEWVPVDQLGLDANAERKLGSEYCHNCPVGCSQMKLVKEGELAGTMSEGPEFESIYSLGGQTGVDDLDYVIAADRLCDELGIDTISGGVTIGFAMELYEKGILTDEDTAGVKLEFGNKKALLDLLADMAYRRGLGNILSDGVKAAAQKIKRGSEKYAMHIKGLELPGYDFRGAKAQGLSCATTYTGADHNRGYSAQEISGIPIPYAVDRFAVKGKGVLTKWNQDIRMSVSDCPTMCGFIFDMALASNATQNVADLLTSLTGLNFKDSDVEIVGERVNNLARVYNILAGFSREDDTFPERIITEPIKGGNSKGHLISKEDLDTMLNEYYLARGWTPQGVPTKEKLLSLGLEYALIALKDL